MKAIPLIEVFFVKIRVVYAPFQRGYSSSRQVMRILYECCFVDRHYAPNDRVMRESAWVTSGISSCFYVKFLVIHSFSEE